MRCLEHLEALENMGAKMKTYACAIYVKGLWVSDCIIKADNDVEAIRNAMDEITIEVDEVEDKKEGK